MEMEPELRALESKVEQLIVLCRRLRMDNHALRQQLAAALNDSKRLNDSMAQARTRLEALVGQIPDDEAVGSAG